MVHTVMLPSTQMPPEIHTNPVSWSSAVSLTIVILSYRRKPFVSEFIALVLDLIVLPYYLQYIKLGQCCRIWVICCVLSIPFCSISIPGWLVPREAGRWLYEITFVIFVLFNTGLYKALWKVWVDILKGRFFLRFSCNKECCDNDIGWESFNALNWSCVSPFSP